MNDWLKVTGDKYTTTYCMKIHEGWLYRIETSYNGTLTNSITFVSKETFYA
jgi:hypothetical protein